MRSVHPRALAAAIAVFCSNLPAQERILEEVIVTATKRAESLQDIPVTVNAFSSEVIQEAGIGNASDLAIMTPSGTTMNAGWLGSTSCLAASSSCVRISLRARGPKTRPVQAVKGDRF